MIHRPCALRRGEATIDPRIFLLRQIERIALVIMLFGLSGLLASGILTPLTWTGAAIALLLTFAIRPVFGMLAQSFCRLPFSGSLAVSFFGVRGIGSICYLAYVQNHGVFDGVEQLWTICRVHDPLVGLRARIDSGSLLIQREKVRRSYAHPAERGVNRLALSHKSR